MLFINCCSIVKTMSKKANASKQPKVNANPDVSSPVTKEKAPVVKISIFDTCHEYAKAGRADALLVIFTEKLAEDETFIDHIHQKSQHTMLTIACEEGQIDVVNMLLDNDCKVDLANGKLNTPLIEASTFGYYGIFTFELNTLTFVWN